VFEKYSERDESIEFSNIYLIASTSYVINLATSPDYYLSKQTGNRECSLRPTFWQYLVLFPTYHFEIIFSPSLSGGRHA